MSTLSSSELVRQQAHIHDDRRGQIVALNVVCLVIVYSAVILRYVSRRLAGTKYGVDDGWISAAVVFVTAFVAGVSTMVHYGLGRHSILIKDARALAISTNVTAICYNTSNMTIKISILYLYRRIFPMRWLKYTLLAVGCFAIGQWISFNFVTIFQCVPIPALWMPVANPRCVKYNVASFVSGILNVATYVLILASPMPAVWRLQVSKAQKKLITVTFLLGGIVCIITIVRLVYIRHWGGEDATYDNVRTVELSSLEISVGTLSACLPVYRPLYNRLVHGKATTNTLDHPSKSYGQLSSDQVLNRVKPVDRARSGYIRPMPDEDEEWLYPKPGFSTHCQSDKKTNSKRSNTGNDIMVTRQIVTATSARS